VAADYSAVTSSLSYSFNKKFVDTRQAASYDNSRDTELNKSQYNLGITNNNENKKLSYRRETARQLPTWREGG